MILATGSVALPIPGVEFGGRVVDTWGAWSLPEQPRKIAVVGAGASGSEIASAYAPPRHRGDPDRDAAADPPRRGQGHRRSRRTRLQETGDRDLHRSAGRERRGRRGSRSSSPTATNRPRSTTSASPAAAAPTPRRLGLAAAGVELDEGGKIKVDPYGQTTNPKVFAIGDLVNKKALAHKAEEEGVVAVERAGGVETQPVDQELLVGATFTHPQVASVGLTEAAAKEAGHEVKIGKQKISGEGAGTVYDDKDGIVKLVVDAKYGEILGAHIVGNRACDMIAELVAAMALEGGAQELARIVHPHPTVSEAVFDAARAVDGWAIHA